MRNGNYTNSGDNIGNNSGNNSSMNSRINSGNTNSGKMARVCTKRKRNGTQDVSC